VELGPGTVLAGLIKKIERGATVVSVEQPIDIGMLESLLEANERRD